MKKKSNKKKGMDFEDKIQKCIGSGSLWFDKGDLKDSKYLYECKTTDKMSYSIKATTLQKIWEEALDAHKLPRMVVGLKDKDGNTFILGVTIEKEMKS